jgi:periplasmic glucans biosynthesis protein
MARRRFTWGLLALSLSSWLCHCANVAERPAARTHAAEDTRTPSHVASFGGAHTAGPALPPAYFEELKQHARALAERPAAPVPKLQLPDVLSQLGYDAYRKIRFRPERSLWRGEPGRFEVQFFPPGFEYRDGVLVWVIDGGSPRRIPFSSDWFSYEGLDAPPDGAGLEFTGLRIHAPLNHESYRDEVVAFHGASYFRPLGKGDVYGLSARGLALDLGAPGPEEFPVFSQLYLVRPDAEDDYIWLLGLLESRRITGAYAFRIQPGPTTMMEISAELFPREPVPGLGVAPLTSMYLFGEDELSRFGDFRPEVHDSDGLVSWSEDGEWLFRPLRNPPQNMVSSFRLNAPRGFGLVQRDRDFDHYQDLEAHYQDRPSVWVEPLAGFGEGSLRLLEIASDTEATDNVAMAWVPDDVSDAPRSLRYRLHVGRSADARSPAGRVLGTRIGHTQKGARFVVDFVGSGLGQRDAVQAVISSVRGRILEQHVEVNRFTEGLRASFEVSAESAAKDVELRAFLRSKADVLTETWSYLWQPKM